MDVDANGDSFKYSCQYQNIQLSQSYTRMYSCFARLVTLCGHFRTYENGADFEFLFYFILFFIFYLVKQKSVLDMASSDSQMRKPQRGRPDRAG